MVSFDHVVGSLTESILLDRSVSSAHTGRPACDAATRFVLEQCERMPDYMRLPFKTLTMAFDMAAILNTGRPFHSLPLEHRRRQIQSWRGSAVGVRRDFIKFYETFATLAWYSGRVSEDGEGAIHG
jgi:hypothetical protein